MESTEDARVGVGDRLTGECSFTEGSLRIGGNCERGSAWAEHPRTGGEGTEPICASSPLVLVSVYCIDDRSVAEESAKAGNASSSPDEAIGWSVRCSYQAESAYLRHFG